MLGILTAGGCGGRFGSAGRTAFVTLGGRARVRAVLAPPARVAGNAGRGAASRPSDAWRNLNTPDDPALAQRPSAAGLAR